MFNKIIILMAIALPVSAWGNPYVIWDRPVISEIQWINNFVWSIELSNKYLPSIHAPCTTDIVKLYLPSSKKIHSTRLFFNAEGLAVLTPSSIIGNSSGQIVTIKNNDTIFIPDPDIDSLNYPRMGWKCKVENIISGNSLICIDVNRFIQTSRSSIGTVGNYTTLHHLFLINRDGKPATNVSAYILDYSDPYINDPVTHLPLQLYCYNRIKTVGIDGQMMLTSKIGESWVAYLSDTAKNAQYCYNVPYGENNYNFDILYPSWTCEYNDELTECNDTLILAQNFQKISVIDSKGNPFDSLHPKIYNVNAGSSLGNGEYLFRLFPDAAGYPVEFYNADTVLIAACTLSYINTLDTLRKTITSFETGINRNPEKKISGTDLNAKFTAIGNLSSGFRFILSIRYPFNRSTIGIYSVDGKKVATVLVPSGAAGTYSVQWNPVDVSGKKLSPGNYLCKFQVNSNIVASKKISIF